MDGVDKIIFERLFKANICLSFNIQERMFLVYWKIKKVRLHDKF